MLTSSTGTKLISAVGHLSLNSSIDVLNTVDKKNKDTSEESHDTSLITDTVSQKTTTNAASKFLAARGIYDYFIEYYRPRDLTTFDRLFAANMNPNPRYVGYLINY